MPYIGPNPAESFTSFATQTFSVSATTSYTLDHAVANENEIALFVNNVRQQPGSGKAYTATGTALTLSAATASTDTMYCVFLGRALQTVTPATNSITAAMVGNDLISGKDALTSSPADTDELLISDAGTLKRIDVSLVGGKNTPVFFAYRSSNQNINDDAATKIEFNAEFFDGDSTYDASTNYRFTPAVAGKYLLNAGLVITPNQTDGINGFLHIYKNGSTFIRIGSDTTFYPNDGASGFNPVISIIVDSDADDYFEVYGQCNTSDSAASAVEGASSAPYKSFFCASKIIT